jgi:hypothetical protein
MQLQATQVPTCQRPKLALLPPAFLGQKNCHFAECQESCGKDVERTFGVLQSRFVIVRYPALTLSPRPNVEGDACLCDHAQHDHRECPRTRARHVGPYECEGPLADVDQ